MRLPHLPRLGFICLGLVGWWASPASFAWQVVLHAIPGTQPAATMGGALALGDVNADGTPDWIVGIRNGQVNGLPTGLVRVYSGLDGTFLREFEGTQGNSAFGSALDFAGDVNGDGVGDVIVGAPLHQEAGEIQNGRAFVFSGLDGSVLYSLGGAGFYDSMGFAVSGVGDANLDGFADFAVGAPGTDNGGNDTGSVTVYSGMDGSVLHAFQGTDPGDLLGSSLAALGDLDADGFPDFAAGARNRDGAQANNGSVVVISGQFGTVLYERFGSAAAQSMGYSLAAIGDLDGDSKVDWIAGSAQDARAGSAAGSFQVYSGASGSLLYDVLGTSAGERLGESVASAQDMDGDGLDDFVVSAPYDGLKGVSAGRVEVRSGATGFVLCTVYGENAYDRLGLGISSAGDFNGDGIPDLAVGIPGADSGGNLSGEVRILAGCRPQGTVYCSPAVTNSTGFAATLLASGSAQVATNQLTLIAQEIPAGQFGYFLVGSNAGWVPNPAGSQGNLCLGGNLGRYNLGPQIQLAGPDGAFQLELDLQALPLPGSPPVTAGQTWYFQCWYRDLDPISTSNFSDAVEILFS
ncbi:MAG: FG-GAP repeat protein [Planctomycetes bacterium]|nr:FG-GAP repeat protein [Planctomycetota bacterium]